jgi:hypothetical protein
MIGVGLGSTVMAITSSQAGLDPLFDGSCAGRLPGNLVKDDSWSKLSTSGVGQETS